MKRSALILPGFFVAVSCSDQSPVEVPAGDPNRTPVASIVLPDDSALFFSGESILFQGTAHDPENGPLTGSSLVWESSIDGTIGAGESFSSTELSPGEHAIRLTASDSEGAIGADTVAISVAPAVSLKIVQPVDERFFSDESIPCEASVAPGSYTDALVWKLDEQEVPCEGGMLSADPEHGEYVLSVELHLHGRTFADSARLNLLQVIQGTIHVLDHRGTEPANTGFAGLVKDGFIVEQVAIDESGGFTIRSRMVEEDTLRIYVDISTGSHYPSHVEASVDEIVSHVQNGRLNFVMIPRRLVITNSTARTEDGRVVDGLIIDIDVEQAFDRDVSLRASDAFFWIRQGRLMSIAASDRPLRIFFDRPGSDQTISSADSVAFWDVIAGMEGELGLGSLFVPTEQPDERTVSLRLDSSIDPRGLASPHTNADNDIVGGGVVLRDRQMLHGETRTLVHEVIHVLGFGHTCWWPSIMGGVGFCTEPIAGRALITEYDIAYIQLLYRVRDAQKELAAPFGLEAANEALPLTSARGLRARHE